jgi:fatty-acyl-CoA synthase
VEPDGTVVLLGRVEQLINSGGEKVHPVEVEAAVRSHPAVREAMVVGIPHTRFGEEVAVIVTLVAGATLSLERLRRHCRPHLASYKLPRRLMVAGELPRTPVGKPDLGRARCVLAGEVEPSTST